MCFFFRKQSRPLKTNSNPLIIRLKWKKTQQVLSCSSQTPLTHTWACQLNVKRVRCDSHKLIFSSIYKYINTNMDVFMAERLFFSLQEDSSADFNWRFISWRSARHRDAESVSGLQNIEHLQIEFRSAWSQTVGLQCFLSQTAQILLWVQSDVCMLYPFRISLIQTLFVSM